MGAGVDGHTKLERALRAAGVVAHADQSVGHTRAVDADRKLVPLARPTLELHAHDVLGIEREVAIGEQAAARTERQAFDLFVLRLLQRQPVDVDHDRHVGIADGEPAQLARRFEIALHDRGRHEQEVGDIVETAARIVGRQQ